MLIITLLLMNFKDFTLTLQVRSFLTSREKSVKIGSSTSSWKHVNGGLPQGTKLGALLFAILINPLLKDWNGRIKFVDDATALEIIPRCSPSLMPILVDEISLFASSRGMKLNSKKCKEMIISFLKYRITEISHTISHRISHTISHVKSYVELEHFHM